MYWHKMRLANVDVIGSNYYLEIEDAYLVLTINLTFRVIKSI